MNIAKVLSFVIGIPLSFGVGACIALQTSPTVECDKNYLITSVTSNQEVKIICNDYNTSYATIIGINCIAKSTEGVDLSLDKVVFTGDIVTVTSKCGN